MAAKQKLFDVCVACIVKDEGRYIEEWLNYNFAIGVDHVYIYDNGSTDNTYDVVKPYVKYGLATFIKWDLFPGQNDAYNHAIKLFGGNTEWMMLIDVDEFLVLKKHKNIYEALAEFEQVDQVLVFWKMFGHSGHVAPPSGSVIESYTSCEEGYSQITKCIVRPERVREAHVHFCVTETSKTTNDAKVRIKETWQHDKASISADVFQLNHYFTKSYEEYREKIARGQVDGRQIKVVEPFDKWNYTHVDRLILPFSDRVRREADRIRHLPLQPFRYGGLGAIGRISAARNFVLFSQDVVRDAIEAGLTPKSSDIQRQGFGTLLRIEDNARREDVNKFIEDHLKGWADTTQSDVCGSYYASPALYRCANAAPEVEAGHFTASTNDPQIVFDLKTPIDLGYVWAAFIVEAAMPTKIEAYVFGKERNGTSTVNGRSFRIVSPGLYLAVMMISEMPLLVDRLRIDPISHPGSFGFHAAHFLRCF